MSEQSKLDEHNLEKEALDRIKKCDLIKVFDDRLSCKSKLLYDVTRVQDTVNLNVMGDFGKTNPRASQDPRWEIVHIIDTANAVILGISQAEYNPEIFWREGSYVHEKVESLEARLFGMGRRHPL